MTTLSTKDPVAVAAVSALHRGDVDALRQLLSEHPSLATARFGDDDPDGMSRTLLHVVTDWPGHSPHGAASVAALVQAGADVNARFRGPHGETPLHWAASSDDVEVLDALVEAGADIDAPGAVIAGGTPLADATAFAQRKAARRLVERGARVNLFAAASLGLMDQLAARVSDVAPADADQVSDAFPGRLPRRPAARRRISARPRRRAELTTGLGATDPTRRDRPQRSNRRDHLAAQPGRQHLQRAARRLTRLYHGLRSSIRLRCIN